MFTGIIEELGAVAHVEPHADVVRLTVRGPKVVEGVRHGDSIAVSGVCLTVVDSDAESFTADVMAQTLRMSTLDDVAEGRPVNLERAALVGDRLGGHIVQGHVDGTAAVLEVRPGDEWRVIRFSLPDGLAALVVDKGSIAVDGVSLTVSALGDEPDGSWFEVSLIPETLTATTLGGLGVGDRVNLETDVLARHVQRMLRLDVHRSLPSSLAEPGAPTTSAAPPAEPAEPIGAER
jgi:riboflavin synthase